MTDFRTYTVDNTVLLLVDHQVGTIDWAGELSNQEERDQLKMWTRVISRFAKATGIPIVLTSSLEEEAQGPLLPEFKEIMPEEYNARIKRTGVINAWDDPALTNAINKTGRKKLLIGGLTTEVCLTPVVLSALDDGFDVVALMDISAAGTRVSTQNSREIMIKAGAELLSVIPIATSMLGDWKSPHAGAFFETFDKEGVFEALKAGKLR